MKTLYVLVWLVEIVMSLVIWFWFIPFMAQV